MDNAETLNVQLTVILEKLKKLKAGNNEQLLSLEKYLQDEICALLDVDASIREYIIKIYKLGFGSERVERNHQFSGSLVEGAMMARCFQKNEDYKEIEMDIMHNAFTIAQQASHLLEPVENKLGFVRLPFCQELCSADFYTSYARGLLGGSENVPYSLDQLPKYISPLVMKNTWKAVIEKVKSVNSFLRLAGCPIHHSDAFSSSDTETTWEVKLDTKTIDNFSSSIDYVEAVRLLFWPNQAEAWITRRRRWWPQQDTIQSIKEKGCQVVPRSSPGGDVHSEFRLSFSGPEASLAQLRSKKQQQAYYFFKMFFYRYLKCAESSEPEGKQLYSYIVKTTMLWVYEELPPEDPIWISLQNSVQFLLLKLLASLKAGFLPHYFIPEINLLERVGQDVISQCIAIISRWQNNILMTAPFDLPEKRKFINFVQSKYLAKFELASVWSNVLR